MIGKSRWQLKKNGKETFYYWKKPVGNVDKMKEKYLLRRLWTPIILNHCLLLTQHDKWLAKTVEKLFKLHLMEDIHPSKCSILNNYSTFYSKFENSVLQSLNVSASHEILMHSQSQRFFVGLINKFRTWKFFTKMFHACITLIIHTETLGHIFSSCMVDILAKIHLRFP